MPDSNGALSRAQNRNFQTLYEAFAADRVLLFSAKHRATGEFHALICGVNYDGDEIEFVPLARIIDEDPFESYESPEEAIEDLAHSA